MRRTQRSPFDKALYQLRLYIGGLRSRHIEFQHVQPGSVYVRNIYSYSHSIVRLIPSRSPQICRKLGDEMGESLAHETGLRHPVEVSRG